MCISIINNHEFLYLATFWFSIILLHRYTCIRIHVYIRYMHGVYKGLISTSVNTNHCILRQSQLVQTDRLNWYLMLGQSLGTKPELTFSGPAISLSSYECNHLKFTCTPPTGTEDLDTTISDDIYYSRWHSNSLEQL